MGKRQRYIAIILCVVAFMSGSVVAHAAVRISSTNDRVWGTTTYRNYAKIDNGPNNIQTKAWTNTGKRDLAVRARQYYQSSNNLCAQSSYKYVYSSAYVLVMYGCNSGNFYSRGRTGFWRSSYQSYYYFNTFRTSALSF